MELGDLEVEVLRLLGTMGESRPQEIHGRLHRTHPVAYTTVTNTLYRLVDKRLVRVRRVGPRRAYYALVEDPEVRVRAARKLLSRLVRAFGPEAISRLMEEEASRPPGRRQRRSRKGS